MSYMIVENMEIVEGKVMVTAACSNVYPMSFDTYEAEKLSAMAAEQGRKQLFAWMAVAKRDGGCKFVGEQGLLKPMKNAYRKLTTDLISFLDDKRLGDFVGEYAEALMCGTRLKAKTRLNNLEALRKDGDAVIEICKERPEAFAYADERVQKDRAVAGRYINACADMLLFEMPSFYTDDKELVMCAVKRNGCCYRKISERLQRDKEIILLAFNDSIQRKYTEHLPDLIPEEIRQNKAFVRELLGTSTCLHVSRAPELVADREHALIWVTRGKYVLADFYVLRKKLMEDPEIQEILWNRFTEPQQIELLHRKLREAGVTVIVREAA